MVELRTTVNGEARELKVLPDESALHAVRERLDLTGCKLGCRNLRWKSLSRELDDPAEIALAFAKNQVPYTCLATCRNWGPDDQLAAPELCHSGRPCFRPSPLKIRLPESPE